MKAIQVILACLGRICLGGYFIIEGINHLFNWNGAIQSLQNGLCKWAENSSSFPQAIPMVDTLLMWAPTIISIGLFFLLFGGLLVFFGVKPRLGAFFLILYMIPITLIFHSFWLAGPGEKSFHTAMFMKQLAIIGGLLIVLAFGNGPSSKKVASKPEREG